MGGIGGMFLKSFSLEFALDLNRIQIKTEITEVYFCCIFYVLRVKTWFRIKHAEAYLNKRNYKTAVFINLCNKHTSAFKKVYSLLSPQKLKVHLPQG